MSFDTNGCVQFSSGYKSDFHIELTKSIDPAVLLALLRRPVLAG